MTGFQVRDFHFCDDEIILFFTMPTSHFKSPASTPSIYNLLPTLRCFMSSRYLKGCGC